MLGPGQRGEGSNKMRAGHEKKKMKKKVWEKERKKAASQCRGNAGILELKQTEKDPAIFVSNPSLKKGKGENGWAAQSRRRNRRLRFRGWVCWSRLISDTFGPLWFLLGMRSGEGVDLEILAKLNSTVAPFILHVAKLELLISVG